MDSEKDIFTCVLRTWELCEYEPLFKKFKEKRIPYYHDRKFPRAVDLFRMGPAYLFNTWHSVYVPAKNAKEAVDLIEEYVNESGVPRDIFVTGKNTSLTEHIESALFYLFILIIIYIIIRLVLQALQISGADGL